LLFWSQINLQVVGTFLLDLVPGKAHQPWLQRSDLKPFSVARWVSNPLLTHALKQSNWFDRPCGPLIFRPVVWVIDNPVLAMANKKDTQLIRGAIDNGLAASRSTD
jgi:hypothetical protein